MSLPDAIAFYRAHLENTNVSVHSLLSVYVRYWTPENVNKSKIGNKSKTAVFICNGKAIVVVVVVGRRRCCCYLFNHFFNCAICLAITPTNEISKKIKTANNTGGGTREEEQKKKQNKQLHYQRTTTEFYWQIHLFSHSFIGRTM